MMQFQLVRHGTIILTVNNKKILVDPVLSEAGTMSPIEDVPNTNHNPLVDLPISIEDILCCDAVIITHTHRDHFDDEAAKLLPKDKPIFCQPEDEQKLINHGFTEIHSVKDFYVWNDINLQRTGGRHGHGEIALKMAPVSGFVLSYSSEPGIYIAGDTVWCDEVKTAIDKFKPEVIICNCGAAQFSFGKPITMNAEDIYTLCSTYPDIKVIAVHMEAWNHCRLSRASLKEFIAEKNIENTVYIPSDGEQLNI